VIQQRDRDGPRRVRVCARGKRHETVYRSGPWEAVFGIGCRVDGRPGVCARRVDVERGRGALADLGELDACETCGVPL
jgi:hypothetical protein